MFITTNAPHSEGAKLITNDEVKISDSATLVVLLHGYQIGSKSLTDVRKTLQSIEGFKDADVLAPELPFSTFSMADSSEIVLEILRAVDKAWDQRNKINKPYQRIVFVGHSIGALYARKAYIVASGENADTKFDSHLTELATADGYSVLSPRPWAKNVERVILLAGMNRGWSISRHMSVTTAVSMQGAIFLGRILEWVYEQPPIIFSMRRGSPFITQLRLQWLSMKRHAEEKGVGNAATIQLLGTIDDLVSPEDDVDFAVSTGFSYIEVPESGHKNVIFMDDSHAGKKRQEAFKQALLTEGIAQPKPIDDKDITDMVFVVHGIRDQGYWTKIVARRLRLVANADNYRVATETSSYGFFPILSFLVPGARQEKVQWFMDKYTEAKARYPDANFHFIGHSYGTYLLTKALEDYPAVTFKNVLFAGSVVNQGFAWSKYVPDRIGQVYNFEATADWVVAFFPKAMQSVGIKDLGSAGHDGFKEAEHLTDSVRNHSYVIGGHSAGIQEAMWDSMAEFVLTGDFVTPPEFIIADEQEAYISGPAKVSPLIWIIGILILIYIPYALLKSNIREWKKKLLILVYFYAIWIVLTRV
jgi:pimeloyl-ACP methyl ester carboxylesterase